VGARVRQVRENGWGHRFVRIRPVSAIEEGFLRDALEHATGRATTLDGHTLTPEAITTIFGAGSTLERVLLTEGRILDHGRHVRLITGPLRDAMVVRDIGCRFPSPTGTRCDAPVVWIDGHHITHWREGGVTSLDNTAALCANHLPSHRATHRPTTRRNRRGGSRRRGARLLAGAHPTLLPTDRRSERPSRAPRLQRAAAPAAR
jgi:hypothetical protein